MAVLWQVLFASAAWKSCRSSRVLAQESRLLHGPIYFYLSLFSFFFPLYYRTKNPNSSQTHAKGKKIRIRSRLVKEWFQTSTQAKKTTLTTIFLL